MAYNKNGLILMGSVPYSGGWRFWAYRSADAIGTVRIAGYISNAKEMGMNVDDTVLVIDTTNHLQHLCYVAGISSAGAADLTNGLAITSTNSD